MDLNELLAPMIDSEEGTLFTSIKDIQPYKTIIFYNWTLREAQEFVQNHNACLAQRALVPGLCEALEELIGHTPAFMKMPYDTREEWLKKTLAAAKAAMEGEPVVIAPCQCGQCTFAPDPYDGPTQEYEEAATIKPQPPEPCPTCGGSGLRGLTECASMTCPACHGSGRKEKET